MPAIAVERACNPYAYRRWQHPLFGVPPILIKLRQPTTTLCQLLLRMCIRTDESERTKSEKGYGDDEL